MAHNRPQTLIRSDVRFGSKADMCSAKGHVRFTPERGHVRCNQGTLWAKRWGNRPALLWIAERFWVLRFRLMVKRGHRGYGPQASEGEAQHGAFCRTGRVSQ